MRHQKLRNKLSRDSAHRRAMLMNLVKEILDHERIKTSEAKAKAVKPELEKLITLGKRGDLHARRQALSALGQDKFAVYKLFEEVAPRYADRQGGYTRILKLGPRRSRRDRDGLHRARLDDSRGGPGPGPGRPARLAARACGALGTRPLMVTKLTLEYDGGAFAGWARQPELRTVQGEVEDALARILEQPLTLAVAGRTDRGVHAWSQVASYPPRGRRPVRLNALLPADVAVLAAEPAARRLRRPSRRGGAHLLLPGAGSPLAERVRARPCPVVRLTG